MESLPARRMTLEELDRVTARIRPFPLAEDVTPKERCDFSGIPDDVLLTTPPHLIVHLQRTAAQGGFQVISPRQTPLCCMMSRISAPTRHLGDHIVGSIADYDDEWPTIDDADMSALLPDEPLPPRDNDPTLRMKTRTKSLTAASHLMSDPITACLVKGRAVIDVLNRPDVQGDGHGVMMLLADAWGIDPNDLMDLDAFSLGFEGDMLRHAIKVDEVYPTMYAPIHQRRCISVGSNEVNRECLPTDSALDWRRMRVFCEAVFALTISIEGVPLGKIRAVPPPGDMTAPGNRAHVMAFLPSPCTAWTYAPQTFALTPVIAERVEKPKKIPEEVIMALTRYIGLVKPVSHAMDKGFRPQTRMTHMLENTTPIAETIQLSYQVVTRAIITHGARGRTAAASVRNYIFEVMEGMTTDDAMRVNRYIQLANSEVSAHLGVSVVPDMIIDRLADRFLNVGEKIRLKVTAEATLRGHSVAEWWNDITSQTSSRYKGMKEGTMGWARVAMYLMFRQPTDKWMKLVKAINFNTVIDAAARSVGGIPLPPEKESVARIESAARYVAKQVGKTYAGHYMGVADVGMSIADYMISVGKDRSAEVMRQAAYLWVLRSRVFRAVNVTTVPTGYDKRNWNHYVARGSTIDLNLAPAPYRFYEAYRTGVMKSDFLPKRYKTQLPKDIPGRISKIFQDMSGPIMPCKETELTKYLINPQKLGHDMEKAWSMLVTDMDRVLETYGPKLEEKVVPTPQVTQVMQSTDLGLSIPFRPAGSGRGYFDVIADMVGEEADYVDELLETVGDEMADIVMEEEFDSVSHIVVRLKGIIAVQEAARSKNRETIR